MTRQKSSLKWAITVVAFAGLGVPRSAFAAAPPPQTPFVAAVLRNFDTWDTSHDGVLSTDETDRAVRNPAVKGDDAAAAASIKLISRGKKVTLPPLTKTYFMEVDAAGKPRLDAASAEEATQDVLPPDGLARASKPEAQPEWARYFAASRARIAKGGSGGVWQPSTMSLDHLQQGPLGDCFFIASVGSIVAHRPELLQSMVLPMGDGSFQVTFPNASRPIRVPALTDGERAISSTTPDDGAWMAVLEQAYGRYRSILKGGSDDIDGTDILRKGGDSSIALMQLTGHRTRRITFPQTLQLRAARQDTVLPQVRRALTENITGHRLITAGVDPPTQEDYDKSMKDAAAKSGKPLGELGTVPMPPPGVQKNHVYTIVAFDAATDQITMWNPHGQTWEPKGTPGLVNGYRTRHGLFTLPLEEAYRFYTSFTFETDQPAEKPTAVTSAAR